MPAVEQMPRQIPAVTPAEPAVYDNTEIRLQQVLANRLVPQLFTMDLTERLDVWVVLGIQSAW